jgi:ethanolamine utilization protein EutQ (cupin superfamily)
MMPEELPLVVRWNTYALDHTDPLRRFALSRFNYFVKDAEARVMVGFWEVEDGEEVVGEIIGGGTADEIMVVLEGHLYVSTPGMAEKVAGPGDVVAAMRTRQTRVVARAKAKVLFVCWRIDPEKVEEAMSPREASP